MIKCLSAVISSPNNALYQALQERLFQDLTMTPFSVSTRTTII
ncbi:MAG: hypothetical protein AB2L11_13505 [Syntrophobacteraceae bacterium]